MVAEQSPATRNPASTRVVCLSSGELRGGRCGLVVVSIVDSVSPSCSLIFESATAGRLQRVGMNARPNRYGELTDWHRAEVDRLINAIASGRRLSGTPDGGFHIEGWPRVVVDDDGGFHIEGRS